MAFLWPKFMATKWRAKRGVRGIQRGARGGETWTKRGTGVGGGAALVTAMCQRQFASE